MTASICTATGMADPVNAVCYLPIVPIKLLAEPEQDRTQHHHADELHGHSPACAGLAQRED
jgi:hypothetical protein